MQNEDTLHSAPTVATPKVPTLLAQHSEIDARLARIDLTQMYLLVLLVLLNVLAGADLVGVLYLVGHGVR